MGKDAQEIALKESLSTAILIHSWSDNYQLCQDVKKRVIWPLMIYFNHDFLLFLLYLCLSIISTLSMLVYYLEISVTSIHNHFILRNNSKFFGWNQPCFLLVAVIQSISKPTCVHIWSPSMCELCNSWSMFKLCYEVIFCVMRRFFSSTNCI